MVEAFGGVDVANPHHQMTIHQQRLDRYVPPPRRRVQPVAVESVGQRFDAQVNQCRVTVDIGTFVPEQRPEAARIAKTQNGPSEYEIDVVVLLRRRLRRHQAQTA